MDVIIQMFQFHNSKDGENMISKILSAAFLALLLLIQNEAAAKVTFDYPGWIFEKTNYPGIPSKDVDEYREELRDWSSSFGIELLDSSFDYVSSWLDIGFTADILVNIDGVEQTLFNADYPISDQMRDILFIESFQNSIKEWKKDCIEPMGTSTGASLRDAYSRAFELFSIYQEYAGKPGFRGKYANPVVSAIFGAGSTSYGNLFAENGVIEGVVEDKIRNFGSSIATEEDILDSLKISKTDMVSYATDFFVELFSNVKVIDDDTELQLKNFSTGGVALVEGGAALAIAPAKMFYEIADYLMCNS